MNRKLVARLAAVGCALATTAGVSFAIADGDGAVMPREVVAAASVFCAYMDRAAAVNSRMTSGAAVADGLKTGAAYEPVQFEEGMIGYAAMAALRDDRFLAGIDYAARREGRQALIQRLAADPAQVLQIDGAAQAALRAQSALSERGQTLARAGGEAKLAAYSLQRQSWSTAKVIDHAQRLAGVKALSATPFASAAGDEARLVDAVSRVPVSSGYAQTVSPVVLRSLALAADAVLGAARGEDLTYLRPLLSEGGSARCLKMAKLNLYQCMAVAGPQYEDVFCLGQHELIDTGQCVASASGSPP